METGVEGLLHRHHDVGLVLLPAGGAPRARGLPVERTLARPPGPGPGPGPSPAPAPSPSPSPARLQGMPPTSFPNPPMSLYARLASTSRASCTVADETSFLTDIPHYS
eukprot:8410592-Pyramimonas_sp.AAC.1